MGNEHERGEIEVPAKKHDMPVHQFLQAVTMLNNGYDVKAISQFLGLGKWVIRHRLLEAGLNTGINARRSGEKHHNWKGGKISSRGYVFIKVSDHPKANNWGYVKENILVMEKSLGRYLVDGEDSHHIDGNKSNNSLDNLELLSHGEHASLHSRGEQNNWAKLKESDVIYIRESDKSNKSLAKEFKVSRDAIWRIKKGINWKHLK